MSDEDRVPSIWRRNEAEPDDTASIFTDSGEAADQEWAKRMDAEAAEYRKLVESGEIIPGKPNKRRRGT